jgi:hypothetical protein
LNSINPQDAFLINEHILKDLPEITIVEGGEKQKDAAK